MGPQGPGAGGDGGGAGAGTSGTAGAGGAGTGGSTGTGTGTGGTAGAGTAGTGRRRGDRHRRNRRHGGHGHRARGSSCTTPPAASELVGWAANGTGTTGGGSATPQTVTTLAALNAAAAGTNPAVIYVTGVLAARHGHDRLEQDHRRAVRRRDPRTRRHQRLVERHRPQHQDRGLRRRQLRARSRTTTRRSAARRATTPSRSQRAHHIWFDHDDISDGTDGNLDITIGSDFVTVSWTKFHYTARTDNTGNDSTGAAGHRYSNLVGGGDNSSRRRRQAERHLAPQLVGGQGRRAPAAHPLRQEPPLQQPVDVVGRQLLRARRHERADPAREQRLRRREDARTSSTTRPTRARPTSRPRTTSTAARRARQATGGGGTPFTTPSYTYRLDAASTVQAAVQAGAGPHDDGVRSPAWAAHGACGGVSVQRAVIVMPPRSASSGRRRTVGLVGRIDSAGSPPSTGR